MFYCLLLLVYLHRIQERVPSEGVLRDRLDVVAMKTTKQEDKIS